jgi:hypothetical protein
MVIDLVHRHSRSKVDTAVSAEGNPALCRSPSQPHSRLDLEWTLKAGIDGLNSPNIVGDYLYRIEQR